MAQHNSIAWHSDYVMSDILSTCRDLNTEISFTARELVEKMLLSQLLDATSKTVEEYEPEHGKPVDIETGVLFVESLATLAEVCLTLVINDGKDDTETVLEGHSQPKPPKLESDQRDQLLKVARWAMFHIQSKAEQLQDKPYEPGEDWL